MTIGYSLISAILIYGLKVYDGGGGLQIFLYSGICSLVIWVISLRGKTDIQKYRIKESYINHTLSFIGVVIAFISWPQFNAAGALISSINALSGAASSLISSASTNTYLGLSTAIIISMVLASKDTK
jgi:ammonia channel protein AmtB